MQTTVKDTYASVQVRMMFLAFLFVTFLSIVVIVLESYNLANNDDTIAQVIVILSIFLGILYSQIAMLIVEVVYQDELQHLPLVSYLARLAPELSIHQRYAYLSMIFKRQTTSVVSLMATWIVVGGTHRAAALVVSMTIITLFTLYGMHYMERLHILYLEEMDSSETDD